MGVFEFILEDGMVANVTDLTNAKLYLECVYSRLGKQSRHERYSLGDFRGVFKPLKYIFFLNFFHILKILSILNRHIYKKFVN
jgi:hypothetical protein